MNKAFLIATLLGVLLAVQSASAYSFYTSARVSAEGGYAVTGPVNDIAETRAPEAGTMNKFDGWFTQYASGKASGIGKLYLYDMQCNSRLLWFCRQIKVSLDKIDYAEISEEEIVVEGSGSYYGIGLFVINKPWEWCYTHISDKSYCDTHSKQALATRVSGALDTISIHIADGEMDFSAGNNGQTFVTVEDMDAHTYIRER